MRVWTDQDVHEALLYWGWRSCREFDRGIGHAREAQGFMERKGRPSRALSPTLVAAEFDTVDAAVHELDEPRRIVVMCYYRPGHVMLPGLNGHGRQHAPSSRMIAVHLRVSHTTVLARLALARDHIKFRLTCAG